MQTCSLCPLLRGVRKSGGGSSRATCAPCTTHRAVPCSTSPRAATGHRWLTISITLLGWLGWRALHDLLSAIPDSNDDFGLF